MKQYDAHSILIVSTANGLRERERTPPGDIFLRSDAENNEIQINGDAGE